MAKWHTLIDRFIQGELSPLLYGQVRGEALKDGCKEILNGFVTPQGPVMTRMGTNHLLSYDGLSHNDMRLWRFIGPSALRNKDLFALFFDNKVSILDWKDGVIGGSTDIYYQIITNSNFTLNANDWVIETNDDKTNTYGQWLLGFFYPRFQFVEVEISSVIPTDIIPVGYKSPSQMIRQSNQTPVPSQDYVLQANVRLFTTVTAGDAYLPEDWRYVCKLSIGTTEGGEEIASEEFELEYLVDRLFSLNYVAPAELPAGTTIWHQVEFFMEAITAPTSYLGNNIRINMAIDNVYGYVRPLATVGPVEIDTVYAGEELKDLHFVQSPYNNKELICLHPDHPPQSLHTSDGVNWTFEPYPFVNSPVSWGIDNKWPCIGAGIQGRLALSGLESSPEIIWMSKSGDWVDFDQGTSLPDEAIEFTAQVRDVNTWIMGGKAALYGDRIKEHRITSSQFLAPNDIGVSVQTSFGSERNPQKITMGKSVVLSTGGNNDLRLCFYNDDDGGFIAPNIILKAEHLGKREFKRHFYTRDPNQVLWNVMRDGTILLCSFDDEYNVQAWSKFETDGVILDGCSIHDEEGRDVVILVISRMIEGQQSVRIETVYPLRDFRSWNTLDAQITVFPNFPDEELQGGFGALEGKEVAVIADFQYQGMQVVQNGQVRIEEPAVRLEVGLPYTFRIETYPQPSMTPDIGLTSKKRYSKVGVRALFSVPPIINGQRPPDRSPQALMNDSEPVQQVLDSEVVDMDINEEATITVEETLPVRLTIAAIYGKLTSEEL